MKSLNWDKFYRTHGEHMVINEKDVKFSNFLISKMDLKMNLRIITKNHADDSKIGSLLKIDFKAEWTHESMPTAWELKFNKIVKRAE